MHMHRTQLHTASVTRSYAASRQIQQAGRTQTHLGSRQSSARHAGGGWNLPNQSSLLFTGGQRLLGLQDCSGLGTELLQIQNSKVMQLGLAVSERRQTCHALLPSQCRASTCRPCLQQARSASNCGNQGSAAVFAAGPLNRCRPTCTARMCASILATGERGSAPRDAAPGSSSTSAGTAASPGRSGAAGEGWGG